MEYQWLFKHPNPLKIKKYMSNGITETMSRVLINREISLPNYKKIKTDLNPMLDYFLNNIKDMQKAALYFIEEIKKSNTHIFVFADYDVDGITSAAIANNMLKQILQCYNMDENNIHIHVPERDDGYGMNMTWCKEVKNKKRPEDNFLVLTFDNGITKVKEVEYLKANDIKVIITDHHEPDITLPNCIIVDPKKDKDRIGEMFCGAEICFLFFMSIARYLADELETIEQEALSIELGKCLQLAAIGTISDMMPMDTVNISLVRQGLEILNNSDYVPIQALKGFFEIVEITSKDIGFSIGAALNACGQMGQAKLAYSLFVCEDIQIAEAIAKRIYEIYSKNRNITKARKADIQEKIDSGAFAYDELCIHIEKDIPKGIAGKLAQSISNSTGKPAIVLIDNDKEELYGSGRSGDSSFNLLEILNSSINKGFIKNASGHKVACGVCFYRDYLDDIQEETNSYIENLKEKGFVDIAAKKPLYIDKVISLNEICEKSYKDIIDLPYSMNFAAPIFMIKGEILDVSHSKSNNNNVCYTLKDKTTGKTMKIWTWNIKPNEYNKKIHKEIKIAGNLTRNFMAPKTFTLDVIDLKFA